MSLFSHTAPCPYCYTEIDLRHPDMRCLGRPAAGMKACEKGVDESRQRELNDSQPIYYPAFSVTGRLSRSGTAVCPSCHGETGVRLCPQCHSRLPEAFDEDSPMFGLVGARDSGKTVMLAVLMHELGMNGPVIRRFDRDVISVYGTKDVRSQAYELQEKLDSMARDGGLPEQTKVSSKKSGVPVVFEWKSPRDGLRKSLSGDYKSTVFSFYDTAGEELATDERALDLKYLQATTGVILLLDPFSFPANFHDDDKHVETSAEAVLHAVTEVLRQSEHVKRGRKIQQPIAVVISKIDAFFPDIPETDPVRQPSPDVPYFDEAEAADVHEHMASLVDKWGGSGLLQMLDVNYANYRLFGLSALGAEPDYGTHTMDQRGLLPHRVTEPILWLMSQHGFIESRG